jgi:hypothetical protein
MNNSTVQLIKQFIYESDKYIFSYSITRLLYWLKSLMIQLNSTNQNVTNEIERIIFSLVVAISNDSTININLIHMFSEIVIEIIDKKIENNQDITDLLFIFDKLKISHNIELEMSRMTI